MATGSGAKIMARTAPLLRGFAGLSLPARIAIVTGGALLLGVLGGETGLLWLCLGLLIVVLIVVKEMADTSRGVASPLGEAESAPGDPPAPRAAQPSSPPPGADAPPPIPVREAAPRKAESRPAPPIYGDRTPAILTPMILLLCAALIGGVVMGLEDLPPDVRKEGVNFAAVLGAVGIAVWLLSNLRILAVIALAIAFLGGASLGAAYVKMSIEAQAVLVTISDPATRYHDGCYADAAMRDPRFLARQVAAWLGVRHEAGDIMSAILRRDGARPAFLERADLDCALRLKALIDAGIVAPAAR